MEETPNHHRSLLISNYRSFIDFANKHFTLPKYIIRNDKDIFYQIEKMMLTILVLSIVVLCTLHLMPEWLAVALAILLVQRVFEYVVVYSRNFIFHRGRIFTDFKDPAQQGEWLIMTVSLNLLQLIITFSVWYRLLGLLEPASFIGDMSIINSVYFSVVTFLTVGFGDIVPVSSLAKILVLFQTALTFYTLVIVVNGLISIHFRNR
ncbi:two pore domain potassium channel family protein [Candidatus Peregrinibacteria bacterium]|nr:two pore domain potassium channel family protein [Candidatus Peregrinibacteria bacterium]